MRLAAGIRPHPLRSYSAPPELLAVIRGGEEKEREGRKGRGEKSEGGKRGEGRRGERRERKGREWRGGKRGTCFMALGVDDSVYGCPAKCYRNLVTPKFVEP